MTGYGPHNTPLNRFNVTKLWSSVLKALNLEKGILYTLTGLVIRPGEVLNTYLFEDRTKMTKPLSFLLLAVGISTFLTINLIGLEETMLAGMNAGAGETDPEQAEFMKMYSTKFTQYYNIIQLLSVPFLALSSYLFFKKHKYNYAEHLVIAAYLTGILNAIYILVIPIAMFDFMLVSLMFIFIYFVHLTYAYIQVFNEPIGIGIVKSIATQIFYYFSFFLVMMVVFMIIGFLMPYTFSYGKLFENWKEIQSRFLM